MFNAKGPIAMFVDGPSLFCAARALEFEIDYKRLLATFQDNGRLLRASYFTPLAETDDHLAIKPLLDFMEYNGWRVVTKLTKCFEDEDGKRRTKGNINVDLTIEAVKMAPLISHAVLFSGARDFIPLVTYLQDQGTHVSVVSTLRTNPAMVADDLRRQADHFIELDTLRTEIARAARNPAAA